ncbi:MAG: hypothetical protein ACREIF_06330 [Chthoniobacterales bacterium]
MRRLLLTTAIAIGCLVAFLVGWIAGARSLSLALDRVHTVPMDSQPITQLGLEEVSSGMLWIDHLPMSGAMPDYHPYPMQMKVDSARRFVVKTAGHAIALGPVDESSGLALKPEPGDKARLQLDRSMLSWPTPFELNFVSGQSPSWKRHLYYRLRWEKPDGRSLEMVWRYEQPYYNKWASGFMTHEGTTGLLSVNIRP